MKKDITCRDWKMKYCCENLWGTPGLYALVSHFANGKVPRYYYFYSLLAERSLRSPPSRFLVFLQLILSLSLNVGGIRTPPGHPRIQLPNLSEIRPNLRIFY